MRAQASLQYFDLALKVVYFFLQTGHFFSILIPAYYTAWKGINLQLKMALMRWIVIKQIVSSFCLNISVMTMHVQKEGIS